MADFDGYRPELRNVIGDMTAGEVRRVWLCTGHPCEVWDLELWWFGPLHKECESVAPGQSEERVRALMGRAPDRIERGADGDERWGYVSPYGSRPVLWIVFRDGRVIDTIDGK